MYIMPLNVQDANRGRAVPLYEVSMGIEWSHFVGDLSRLYYPVISGIIDCTIPFLSGVISGCGVLL